MNLLGAATYDPAVSVTKSTAALLAMTVIDASGNTRVTGTVPPSGRVYWKIKCAISGAATYPQVLLGVMSGATVLSRAPAMLSGSNLAATTICAAWAEGVITGLTPGAAFTYEAAYAVETLVAATGIKYGGPNTATTATDAFGAFQFEIWDPSPVYTPASGAAPTTTISARLDTEITAVASVQADTDNIQTRLPAALVSGRMDSSVGAMAADVLTAAATAADFGTEVGTAVWASTTRLLTAGTNIALAKGTGITGFNDLDAAGVRGAVGLASANLDTQLTTIDDFLDTEVAAIKTKTDFLPSVTAGAAGGLFIAGGNAATTVNITGNLSGSVGSVTGLTAANLDVAVSTRLAGASYAAPLDAAATRAAVGLASANLDTQLSGINAKTTNLPSDPADASDIAAAFSTVNGTLSTIAGYIDTEVGAIKTDTAAIKLKTDGLPAAPASSGDVTTVEAAVAAVKAQTDQLAFTSGNVHANVEAINTVAVIGTGASGDKWRA